MVSLESEPWGTFSLHGGGEETEKRGRLHKNSALRGGRKGYYGIWLFENFLF